MIGASQSLLVEDNRESDRLLFQVRSALYNIAPRQQVLVARKHDGRREGVAF
jgi:hypothetical protein